MKKFYSLSFLIIILISSCSNINHISNNFKWKNLRLSETVKYKLIFEPTVSESFHPNSHQLLEYFYDTYHLDSFKIVLIEKLKNRGMQLNNDDYDIIIRVDQLKISELVEVVKVDLSQPFEQAVSGTFFNYKMDMKFEGRILEDDVIRKFNVEKQIVSHPSKSTDTKYYIKHSNWDLDFDKIFENLINKMSVEIFYACEKQSEFADSGY